MSLNPTVPILIGLYISQRVSGIDEISKGFSLYPSLLGNLSFLATDNSTSTTLTPTCEPTFAPSFFNSTEERIEKISELQEPSGIDGYMIFLFALIFIILVAFYYFIR